MQFHALQQDVIPNDWKANRIAIEKQLHAVQLNRGDFVVLTEMTDTGWPNCVDGENGATRSMDIGTTSWASSLSKELGVWIQVGWADKNGSKAKNCATICNPDGKEVATYTKVFTCNPFGENEYYDCGDEVVIVDIGIARICPMICYDLRFPELWRPAAIESVDVFTVSSSWPLARIGHWEGMLVGRTIENQAAVVASNRVGVDSIATWGGTSMIVSEHGVVLEKASTKAAAAISADIDIDQIRKNRLGFPVFDDVKQDLIGNISVRTVHAC